jgi:hypothetical protein
MATNNFKLISSDTISSTTNSLINTAATDTTLVIHSVYLTNTGEAITYANVTIEDSSSGVSTRVAYKTPIPSGDTLILDKPLNLEAGDKIYVRGANLEVTVSALEIS